MSQHLDQTAMDNARALMNAVDEALNERATFHRDDSPLPTYGTAPPVAQPGRPPMSQKATDASALMLSGGAATFLVGGTASLLMLASGHADPVVCAVVLGAPTVLVLALSRLVSRAKDAMPGDTHHHYTGTVQQTNQTVQHSSSWFGRSTTNL